MLFAPQTPLVFMGEEYDEQRPFQFFTDHIDPAIAEATRKGRRAEVARSGAGGDVPDPQAAETFERSKLEPREPDPLFRELLALRRDAAARARGAADDGGATLAPRARRRSSSTSEAKTWSSGVLRSGAKSPGRPRAGLPRSSFSCRLWERRQS